MLFNKTLLSILFCASVIHTNAQKQLNPMMGWSSWNTFRVRIHEDLIKASADAMVDKGLKDAGYLYCNIDDGYFGGRDAEGKLFPNPAKFPNGMKAVAEHIHLLGLKAGIYSDAGSNTCGSIYDGDKLGVGVGLFGHETQDCNTFFKEWGYDYIKVDWCGGAATKKSEQERYTSIRASIVATGRTDIRLNICRWQFPGTWAIDVAESWRTQTDIGPNWKVVVHQFDNNLFLAAYAGPGHFNDMDMLEVGRGMTYEEDKSHFGLWCIMSSPLMIGCDIRTLNEQTLSILKNKEVIALNQDPLGLQAKLISQEGDKIVLAKPLEQLHGTIRGVALFNKSEQPQTIRVRFADLNISPKATVRDLWQQKELGVFTDYYEAKVAPHGIALLKVSAKEAFEPFKYEAEYAFMKEYLPKNDSCATFKAKAGTSGGYMMSHLGNNPNNWAEFREVYSKKGGDYRLTIYYLSGENRNMTCTINEGKEILLTDLNSGSWDKVASTSKTIRLKPGKNVIRLGNASAFAPDIDKIEVSRQ